MNDSRSMADALRRAYWTAQGRVCPIDQVANAPDASVNLAGDPVAAAAVTAAWSAVLPGQQVPMLGEPVEPDRYCEPV